MNKKVIVLADNSYTIRRIVELSFSEIENIEVRSFEKGSGIKEKLLQLNPAVVIVDIKLPEINGYDICRFINETPALNRCRIFLMKGSFEPVDNEMIKNLKYEDIITKPFDSNALVSAVMKIVNQEEQKVSGKSAGAGPSSFPEDLPEIETEVPESEDISFSDIRGDIEAPPAGRTAAKNQVPEREEVLPSEEITQGTQPLKDNLLPQESEEAIKNPFDEEPPFEEINVSAPDSSAPPLPEFDTKSELKTPSLAKEPKDASDEFHERFLEIANEDTSEDLLKSSLESSQLPDSGDLLLPGDQAADDKLMDSGGKFALEFDKSELGSPAKTIYAGPGSVADLTPPGPKPEKKIELEFFEGKAFDKGLDVKKAHAEVRSPQAELEKLVNMPKKESKTEPVQPVPGKLELTGKLEEKLSLTIKELLWEIVPPLAEKIIKEEIDKIKSELSNSGL